MSAGEVRILAEHDGLVFANKPVGIPTEPDAKHARSLLVEAAALLGMPAERLHAHSRLDLGVSGVVTLSVSREARQRVVALRARGEWRRRYVALAAGQSSERMGVWREGIGRERGRRRSTHAAQLEPAETHFAVVDQAAFPVAGAAVSLLALEPRTGRTHQLRVHAAAHGLPLLGDRSYGGPQRFPLVDGAIFAIERVALHAAWVSLGAGDAALRVAAPIPEDLAKLWLALSGDGDAWQHACVRELA